MQGQRLEERERAGAGQKAAHRDLQVTGAEGRGERWGEETAPHSSLRAPSTGTLRSARGVGLVTYMAFLPEPRLPGPPLTKPHTILTPAQGLGALSVIIF